MHHPAPAKLVGASGDQFGLGDVDDFLVGEGGCSAGGGRIESGQGRVFTVNVVNLLQDVVERRVRVAIVTLQRSSQRLVGDHHLVVALAHKHPVLAKEVDGRVSLVDLDRLADLALTDQVLTQA